MQLPYSVDPLLDLPVRLYAAHLHGREVLVLGYAPQLQFQHGGVRRVQTRLVYSGEPEPVGLAVGPRNLDHSVHLTDRRNEVRYERLQLCVQLDGVGLVPSDVLKQLGNFGRYLQPRICFLDFDPSARYIDRYFFVLILELE